MSSRSCQLSSRRRCSSLCRQLLEVQESSWGCLVNIADGLVWSGLRWVEGEFAGLGCDGMERRKDGYLLCVHASSWKHTHTFVGHFCTGCSSVKLIFINFTLLGPFHGLSTKHSWQVRNRFIHLLWCVFCQLCVMVHNCAETYSCSVRTISLILFNTHIHMEAHT